MKYFKDPKAFIEFSKDIKYVYKDINDYTMKKDIKILIVFQKQSFRGAL